ncbi:MAG: hypothetical protein WKF36_01190 [Candidatus Nitrosocosmicus sp.]
MISKLDKHISNFKVWDLDKAVLRTKNDCTCRQCKVNDVLVHVMAEEMHHRGEIMEIPWQMNIKAPR